MSHPRPAPVDDEQQVAGLWCREVLAMLSDYVDGTLSPAARANVEAHVQACANCARFGTSFATVVADIRALGATPSDDVDTFTAGVMALIDSPS